MPKMFKGLRKLSHRLTRVVMNYSEIESKVREATNDDSWGPTGKLNAQLARATFNPELYPEVMSMLWKRIRDSRDHPRRLHKSLIVLHYLLINGSGQCISSVKARFYEIDCLREYQHWSIMQPKGRGNNVQIKAKEIVELIQDKERLKKERITAKNNDLKYVGFGQDYSESEAYIQLHYANQEKKELSEKEKSDNANFVGAKEFSTSSINTQKFKNTQPAVVECNVTTNSKASNCDLFPTVEKEQSETKELDLIGLNFSCDTTFLNGETDPFVTSSLEIGDVSPVASISEKDTDNFKLPPPPMPVRRKDFILSSTPQQKQLKSMFHDLEDNDFDPRSGESKTSFLGELENIQQGFGDTSTSFLHPDSYFGFGMPDDEFQVHDITHLDESHNIMNMAFIGTPRAEPSFSTSQSQKLQYNPFADLCSEFEQTIGNESFCSKLSSTNPFLNVENTPVQEYADDSDCFNTNVLSKNPNDVKNTIWDELKFLVDGDLNTFSQPAASQSEGQVPTTWEDIDGIFETESTLKSNNAEEFAIGTLPTNPFYNVSSIPLDPVPAYKTASSTVLQVETIAKESGKDLLKGTTWDGLNICLDSLDFGFSSK